MTTSVGSYESLGLGTATQSSKKTEIGQQDFLKLMTTQLQAQDPFKPMDSSQFLGQIAQFSQVSGLQELNSAFADLSASLTANQTLQGASLVGREVLVAGDQLSLGSNGSVGGAIEVPQSGWLSVDISDASGQVVRHIDYGAQPAGRGDFAWDGLADDGSRLPAGEYQFRAQVSSDSGGSVAAHTFVLGQVIGVQPSSSGLQVEVSGIGTLPLSQIERIQ